MDQPLFRTTGVVQVNDGGEGGSLTAPPMTGPKNRAKDTVLWASPLASPTTCGGDMAFWGISYDSAETEDTSTHDQDHDSGVGKCTSTVSYGTRHQSVQSTGS